MLKRIWVYILLYLLCLTLRIVDVFSLETNVYIQEISLSKLVGILVIIVFLVLSGKNLSYIGIRKERFVQNAAIGLAFMGISLATAYSLEYLFLFLQGRTPVLFVSARAFALSPELITEGAIIFGIVLVISNLVNSTMEEGLFRGVMLAEAKKSSFISLNLFQAFLFGLWHLVWPMQSVLAGLMEPGEAVLIGAGYVLLSGSVGYAWGLLAIYRNSLWPSWFAHTLNNTVLNFVHIGTLDGVNLLLNIRVLISTSIFIAIVLALRERYKIKNDNRVNLNGILSRW